MVDRYLLGGTVAPTLSGLTAIGKVDSIAALKALSPTTLVDKITVEVLSYYSAATPDGGGGTFEWDSTTSATDNGGTVILPTGYAGVGRWRRVNPNTVTLRQFGADGSGNDQAFIAAALSSGALVIDGEGLSFTANSSVEVPASAVFQNFQLTAGAAGINMVLVNSRCKVLNARLIGTGTVSTVERAIYPAANAVEDVELDIEISNITYGVHAQPLSGTALADAPRRWRGSIHCEDIVGTVGASEGYGVLLSPALSCNFNVTGKTIARHLVYLSAGARFNKIWADCDDCGNYVVQIAATSPQSPCIKNEVVVQGRNLTTDVAGQSGHIAITGISHYNTAVIRGEGNATTYEAARIEGGSGGPYPLGNQIINGAIEGQFTGNYVIRMLNADSTRVYGNAIDAYAASGVIGMTRTGTNGSGHGGYVHDNKIDAQAQAIKGVYNECNTQPSYIGPNDIRNNGAALRVDDQTSGYRMGYSRRVKFSGTTASCVAGSVVDTTPTLTSAIQVAGRRTNVWITGSSVTMLTNSNVTAMFTAADETHSNFRVFNAHSADQTFDYEGAVEGD